MPVGELTPAQATVVAHGNGPLLVCGVAGSGRTAALVARFARLVARGDAAGPLDPEQVLVLAPTRAGADALRGELELALGDRGFSELAVHDPPALAGRLLRDEALEAGLEPQVTAVGRADRLALLLDRMDELALRSVDLAGRPAATLARVLARIDRCKAELVGAAAFATWAHALPDDDPRAERERGFAAVYLAHDRMLAEQEALDEGELVLRAHALLRDRPHVRARAAARYRHVLVDDGQDLAPAAEALVRLLGGVHGHLVVALDPDGALGTAGPSSFGAPGGPDADVRAVRLEPSRRCPARVLDAAEAVMAPVRERPAAAGAARPGGDVRFWRCAGERAQAQSVAAEVERVLRAGCPPEQVGILVGSVRTEGQAIAVALEERAVPYRVLGAAALLQRAEVRDVLAWLRLLADPSDASAVVRALARPPVELRSVDLARCVQIARRRKLDMVSALVAATESPQLPPEARERILGFLKLHGQAAGALDTSRPDLFVHRLIDRLGLRRGQLFAAQAGVVERLVALSELSELAAAHTRRFPQSTPREFAAHLAAIADAGLHDDDGEAGALHPGVVGVMATAQARGREFRHVFVLGLDASRMPGAREPGADPVPPELARRPLPAKRAHVERMRRRLHVALTRASQSVVLAYAAASDGGARQPPSAFAEEARAALGAEWEDREEELFGPDEALHATFTALRDELMGSVSRVGGRLGELRLDTDVDVAHGVTRYLELVKLAALIERPAGQSVAEALPSVNERLLQAASAQQREAFETSALDELLLDAEVSTRARAQAVAAREEPSLAAFLPTRGEGLVLSASDIESYRACPLRYKFARVFRIPTEPTINQRFGIVVHQVLERFHTEQRDGAGGGRGGPSVETLLGLLETSWRRSGFGTSDQERQLHGKAVGALERYHARLAEEPAEPVWLERGFQFSLGRHVLRGRVDRVDRLPDGSYELIDYKTGRPRSAEQLREDVQLSLYAVGAREAWQLESSRQAYLYVLDDQKVRVPAAELDTSRITETVEEVAEGILGQGFEPTPSFSACSMCDFRIACPAAER